MNFERRLFQAWSTGRGLHLTHQQVCDLMRDDAIATRVSNAICDEAGVPPMGQDILAMVFDFDWVGAVAKVKAEDSSTE